MIAADYQPLHAAVSRRRTILAGLRVARTQMGHIWHRHRPRVVAAARIAGATIATLIWFGAIFSFFLVSAP